MAKWQEKLMRLAYDFRLDLAKAREIVLEADTVEVPKGKPEIDYKYNKAWDKLRQLMLQKL